MAKASTNSRTVSIKRAEREIILAMRRKRPVFLWGPPGIGKSELVEKIAQDLNGAVIDLRMALMEPTDIRGIPYYNADQQMMCWAPPIDLPTEEFASQYDVVVLFLDELNSAPMATQAAAYQLVLNRKVGTYTLPDNVVIVAAGNRETDRGVTYRMPAPLANRLIHIELAVDFDSWQEWAVKHNVHPDVIGYLTFSKGDLYAFDPASNERAFATPRSWTFVSQLLGDDDHFSVSEGELTDLISGTIGEGLAIKFNAHRKYAGSLPNPSDILSGKVKKADIKEISAMYSLGIGLCYELKEELDNIGGKPNDEWNEKMDNFFLFMMDSFMTEVVVMSARVAMQNYNLPVVTYKLKSFDKFQEKYSRFIVAAGTD